MRTMIDVTLTAAMIYCGFAAFRQRTWMRAVIYGGVAIAIMALFAIFERALAE